MAQGMLSRLRTLLSPPVSIRRRLCWLLGGVGLGMLLAINLVFSGFMNWYNARVALVQK